MFRVLEAGVGLLLGVCCIVAGADGRVFADEAHAWQVSDLEEESKVGWVDSLQTASRPFQSGSREGVAAPRVFLEADALFQEGEEKGNFLPAIEAYRRALLKYPNAPWSRHAHWGIAKGYQNMGHYHEAIPHWGKTLKMVPRGHQALEVSCNLAECLFQAGRYEEALGSLQGLSRVLKSSRKLAWALFRLGDCLLALGLEPEANGRYLQAQALRPDPRWIPMQSLYNMARLALQRSQPERANWPIMTALSLFPDDPQRPRLLYLLGEAFFQQGKLKEAAFVFDKIKNEYPEYGEAHSAQVRLTTLELYNKRESLGFSLGPDPQTWVDPAHPLFHVHPNDPYLQEAVLSLGKLLSKRGEQELAFQLLLNARRGFEETTVSPEILKTLVNVARTNIHEAVQTDRHGRAIEIFDGLTQWVPEVWEDLLVLVDLAESYEAIGFYEMASSFYKKAYLLDRHSSSGWDAMLGLVRMEVGLGHCESALTLLDQVPPDRKWKQTARGLVEWSGSEHCTQSAETINRCLKEIPTGMLSLESVVLLGQYYVDRGQYKHAATFLENALSGKSMRGGESIKWAEAYCLLGESLRHLGRAQEAMTHYEKVLDREPWGFLEKWAAYRDSQVGIEAGARDRVRPYLERLLQEPEGALWRGLAEYLDQRMRPAEENTEEGVSWS